jgi:hypothetical protein
MKPLLLIAGFYAAINAAVLGTIVLSIGFPITGPIAVHRPGGPSQTNEEMALATLLETSQLARAHQPQLIVLGASVAAGAYPPAVVQPNLPGFMANNLAMPGATITEILHIFDEVLWAAPTETLRKSVLVLGASYTSFCPDIVRYSNIAGSRPVWWTAPRPMTYVRKAADRSPPILGIEHPLRAVIPRSLVLAAKQRLRAWGRLLEFLPFHPGEWLSQRGRWRCQTLSMRRERERHEAAFPKPKPILEWFLSLSVKEQTKWLIEQWGKTGTLLDQRQFDALSRLLDRAISADMTVVFVDLPLHGEHRLHTPVLAEFQERLGEVIAAHAGSGRVHLLNLTTALPDETFGDLAHANPKYVESWVDLLVDRLRPLLPDQWPEDRE